MLISIFSINAQPKGGSGRGLNMEKRLEELSEKLSLTVEQEEKVKTILEDMQSETTEMFENRRPDREKMLELRNETDEKILELLTEEQQAKYKELQKERQDMMRRGRLNGRQGRRNVN